MATPSERTIESISNHGFLEILNAGKTAPPFAWFFLPTQNQEALLGFDASLVGLKRLYIQYKRMNKWGKFDFGFRQIWTLCALFPRYQKSYVFLSGNVVPDYPALVGCHGAPSGGRYNAFNRTFFIDAWDIMMLLCEKVNGAPLLAFPNILPAALPTHSGSKYLGNVPVKPWIHLGCYQIHLTKAHTLWKNIVSLLWALNYHGPFQHQSSLASILMGCWQGVGVEFANKTACCSFGKPFSKEPLDRDVISQYVDDLSKLSVLTLPMPSAPK